MQTGHYISGIGHGVLLGWAIFGGLFSSVPEDNLEVAEVSIISAQDFAALSTPEPGPQLNDNVTPPAPRPAVQDPPPAPVQPPAEQTPPPVEDPPEVIKTPEPIAPPEPEPEPVAPQPPAADNPVVLAPPAVTSSPRPSRRVTATTVAPPPPDTEVAEETNEKTTPDAEAPSQAEPKPATAPEESADRIVTEADDPPSSAPKASSRPSVRPKRPDRPKPPVETASNSGSNSASNSASGRQDAIADALAGLQTADTGTPATSAPTGPPLTGGQKDAFLLEVGRCWILGALSTNAMQSKVVVRFELNRDGTPDIGSIRMTGFEGGTAAGAKKAYETARRAIIRCGKNGYNLPTDKYEQWKIVNITFNPENMRLK